MWSALPVLVSLLCPPAEASRLKDVSSLYGVRSNSLTGLGLVIGLNRTGDSSQNPAAVESLVRRMEAQGFTISSADVKSRNVAMVMVTAQLPPDTRAGTAINVRVASTGDARSLEGGVLLPTNLSAANGHAIGTAEGALMIGGYEVSANGESITKNHPTVGIVPGGGKVEVELPRTDYSQMAAFEWILHEDGFGNAVNVATAINVDLGGDFAAAVDSRTVRVEVPDEWLGRQTSLIARVESVDVTIEGPARVVINERTGTVVMGANIRVRPVAVAHGGLTVKVQETTSVSQPRALAAGETKVITETEVTVHEAEGKLTRLEADTVGDIVNTLNAMGVSPRDLIVILTAMKAAGGIDAEILSQ